MEDAIVWSGVNHKTKNKIVNYPIAKSFIDADYVINLAAMKGHHWAGVTLCGKNWFGCFAINFDYDTRFNSANALHDSMARYTPWMKNYRPHVDLMGHQHLGQKTFLYIIDGLWGFQRNWGCYPARYQSSPFNGDYPSSFFFSQDPVAIDSVALDFIRAEYADNMGMANIRSGIDDYLHEGAQAVNPPSETVYDPEGDGTRLQSLGVHEHWNNPKDKQYSRNLHTGKGIELIAVKLESVSDNQMLKKVGGR